jgi:deoxyribodipyrimidine photolyase
MRLKVLIRHPLFHNQNTGQAPFFGRKVFWLYLINSRLISGINKWRFLLQCLDDLDQGLRRLQSRLYVVRGQPLDALPNLIKRTYFSHYLFFRGEYNLKIKNYSVALKISVKHFRGIFLQNQSNIWQSCMTIPIRHSWQRFYISEH